MKASLIRDNRSGIWKVRVPTQTGYKTITTKCTNEGDARRVVRESGVEDVVISARAGKLAQNYAGVLLAGRKLTVDQASKDWQQWAKAYHNSPLTVANYANHVQRWIREMDLGKLAPVSLNESHLDNWINQPDDLQSKLTSIKCRIAALRSFFKFLSIRGYIIGNIAMGLKVKQHMLTHRQKTVRIREAFTDGEIQTLIDATACDPFWYFAVVIGRYTGLRLGDICNLQWDCFTPDLKHMHVFTDKTDQEVLLPMSDPPILADTIGAIPHIHDLYCFPADRLINRDPTRRSTHPTQFGRLCARLGILGKSFHCLRHTYATEAAKAGKPMFHIAKDLGHSSTTTTQGYVHARKDTQNDG